MRLILVIVALSVLASAVHMHDISTRGLFPKRIHYDYVPGIPV